MPATNRTDQRSVRDIDPAELRDTISVTIARELIAELDRQRHNHSRSAYLEMVLDANLRREHPYVPDDWCPEDEDEERFQRLLRYLETGR